MASYCVQTRSTLGSFRVSLNEGCVHARTHSIRAVASHCGSRVCAKLVEHRAGALKVACFGENDRADDNVAPTSQFTSQPFILVDFLNRCWTPLGARIVLLDVRGRVSSTRVHHCPLHIVFESRRTARYREFESLLLRQEKPIEIHRLRRLRVEVWEVPGVPVWYTEYQGVAREGSGSPLRGDVA